MKSKHRQNIPPWPADITLQANKQKKCELLIELSNEAHFELSSRLLFSALSVKGTVWVHPCTTDTVYIDLSAKGQSSPLWGGGGGARGEGEGRRSSMSEKR